MKKDGLFAQILEAIVKHNKAKIRNSKPDYYLNQKKQLWYGMMNQLEPEEDQREGGSEGEKDLSGHS